jgi:hypothetical protein
MSDSQIEGWDDYKPYRVLVTHSAMRPPRFRRMDFVYATRTIQGKRRRGAAEFSVGEVRGISKRHVAIYFIGVNRVVRTYPRNIKRLYLASVGDSKRRKICNRCHLLKPVDEFQFNQAKVHCRRVRRPSCNSCRAKINGVPFDATSRSRLLQRRPAGVYKCPVCRKSAIAGYTAQFRMDHSHQTGKARKWICDSCNTGLGRFDDSQRKLSWALSYLRSNP